MFDLLVNGDGGLTTAGYAVSGIVVAVLVVLAVVIFARSGGGLTIVVISIPAVSSALGRMRSMAAGERAVSGSRMANEK